VFGVDVGAVRLTRVGYADVPLPPETFGLTAADVAAIEWAEPTWAEGTQVRAAAAAWVIESGDARIVVDPAFAADDILRNEQDAATHQEAFAATLAEAGFARETITHAVATHFDGIGMLAWRNDDASWAPFFPNAPVLYSAREPALADVRRYLGASVQLTEDRQTVTDEVTLEHTGAHGAGHQIVRIESQGERAVVVGHLAVVPLQLATGVCEKQHEQPEAAWEVLRAIRDEGTLLIGPLWPAPGCGRWVGNRLVPA
jgi:glyoxylase-like metal-dependent hydrolase (beta-lactamase superfamily II)